MMLFSPVIQAQKDSSLTFSREDWKELSDGTDYTETYKEHPKEKEKPVKSSTTTTETPRLNIDGIKYVIYFLVMGLIITLLVFVIRHFSKSKNSEVNATISLENIQNIEEKIHEVNLEALLQEALASKNYKMALRLHFLIIIKLLSQQGKIDWKKEKTNWEYHSELTDRELAGEFKEIIRSFENFWYGEYPLTEYKYQITVPDYQTLQKRLTPNA
jgi:hypothetical protein